MRKVDGQCMVHDVWFIDLWSMVYGVGVKQGLLPGQGSAGVSWFIGR